MSGRRHGTGLIVGQGDDDVETALFGFSGDDEFAGTDESCECIGVGERGHVREAEVRVAIDAVALQNLFCLGEGCVCVIVDVAGGVGRAGSG